MSSCRFNGKIQTFTNLQVSELNQLFKQIETRKSMVKFKGPMEFTKYIADLYYDNDLGFVMDPEIIEPKKFHYILLSTARKVWFNKSLNWEKLSI